MIIKPDLKTEIGRMIAAKHEMQAKIKKMISEYEQQFGVKVTNISHTRTTAGDRLLSHRVDIEVTI